MCAVGPRTRWVKASFKVSASPLQWWGVMITGLTSRLLQMLVEVILYPETPSQRACVEEVSELDGSAKAELSYRAG